MLRASVRQVISWVLCVQELLMYVISHQPEDPIGYFQEELTKIKKEMEELNVRVTLFYFVFINE